MADDEQCARKSQLPKSSEPMVYRDFCNTCGAPITVRDAGGMRDGQHEEWCHLTGVVVEWSGVAPARAAWDAARDDARRVAAESREHSS